MRRYNPKEIEPKWQEIWDKTQLYKADLHSKKPKYIAMSMFNYPSGSGIHIGHAMNYTISDVLARFKRQQGFESYHPVGWDAFGLPAENYAIKAGVSPQISMAQIIPNYHKQYKAMGWSNDWSKEIATHEPIYYKWTQWIFSQMFKHGLAYLDSRLQWWCSIDNTVLADEQVTPEGKCWRHDGPNDPLVEKKEVKQWFFKITDYADELLEGLENIDWPESIKSMQRNWIGKSSGMEVKFQLDGSAEKIEVFTTAHDTIFGATFMVLAPEHPLVEKLATPEHKSKIEMYIKQAKAKTDIERQTEGRDKTGVFTGSYAINPINEQKIPIWIADYVLLGYGTGAIMAVPGQDIRDFEFAQKYDLPIIYTCSRQEFVDYEEIKSNPKKYKLANSGPFDGLDFTEGRQKIQDKLVELKAGRPKIEYRIRDWSVSRQRYWGAPIPIVHCPKDGVVLVSDEDLPVVLPELEDFEPTGDGRGALARAIDWLNVDCPKCGGPAERETDTMDTYVCSSWYMLRFFDPRNEDNIFDSGIVNRWMPIDFYNGADHATAHLIYARFVTSFFQKLGLVKEPEPFQRFLFNGKVTAPDGQMFSKSKGNAPDPLEIVDSGYGADALRLYLMFAAPLDVWVRWDSQGVPGTYRFLNRLWTLVQEFLESKPTSAANISLERETHKTIKKVTVDLESLKYNTAIASLMSAINELYKIKAEHGIHQSVHWRFALESMLQLTAPFAPFMTEELWSQLGHESSIHISKWPEWDSNLVAEEFFTLVVQINGKVRSEIIVPTDISEAEATKAAKNDAKVAALIADKTVKKAIYVPGRLVSLVI